MPVKNRNHQSIETELLEKKKLLQLLYSVTAIANEAENVKEAMGKCLEKMCEYMAWPVGHIYMVSGSDPDRLIPLGTWYVKGSRQFSVFREITANTEFKKGIGMPGRVLATAEPEWIEDVTENPKFLRWTQDRDIGVKGCFGFPIVVKNKVVLVMEFFSTEAKKKDPKLLESIGHVGNQLGHLAEQVKAAANLSEARVQAEVANRAKKDLMANMNHELRSPLNAVIGFSSIMSSETFGPLNEKYLAYVNDIHSSGEHLLGLINVILDVSAIEAGKLKLEEQNIDIEDVFSASINLVKNRAREGGINLTGDFENGLPRIHADRRRLIQILLNLLTNAIKFTPSGGTISFAASLDRKNCHVFAINDTGVGMDEDELIEATSRFGQIDRGLDRKHDGVGLGLPLTQGLVERHGGTLEILSTKGEGTSVTIRFPIERTVIS